MIQVAASLTGMEEGVEEYVKHLASTFGHADRLRPYTNHCAGLLLPGKRKSLAPMAAVVSPDPAQVGGEYPADTVLAKSGNQEIA